MAVAYTKSGDATRATEYFTLAIDAAEHLEDEFQRARALWTTADAQLTVGRVDAAKATIRRLVETAEPKDPWAKVTALWECAVLAAKANDGQSAHRLFQRAIEAQETVDTANKIEALKLIAVAQAGVGYVDDALKTASTITHNEKDFTYDGRREAALYAIAVAQVKANDADGAVRTAMSVKYYVQYCDDALHKIVDYQIVKRELNSALMVAEKISNTSRKATAILKVAAAHAKAGDRKTAADVAARIQLTAKDSLSVIVGKEHFDYRLPGTWGVRYDAGIAFTNASRHMADRHAAEVAAAAMTLARALGQQPVQSYAVLFNDIHTEEVTLALGRAQAASGDASEALAWAKQIGSSDKIASNDDNDTCWAAQRRVHALVGVAEGILDRLSEVPPEPEPSP